MRRRRLCTSLCRLAISMLKGVAFSQLHTFLSGVLWQYGADWVALPKANGADYRHHELLNMAAQGGQHYIQTELHKLSTDDKVAERYQKDCDKLANWAFKIAGEHLPEDKKSEIKEALNKGLQSILEWVRTSPGVRDWVNLKVPEIIEFLQPYLASLLKRMEVNFLAFKGDYPFYLAKQALEWASLTKRPELDPEKLSPAEQELEMKRITSKRVDAAAGLLGELIDIGFTGTLKGKADAPNLPLPPALSKFAYHKAKEQTTQSMPAKPLRSLLGSLLQDYVLIPLLNYSDSLYQQFLKTEQKAISFVEKQLDPKEEIKEPLEVALTKVATGVVESQLEGLKKSEEKQKSLIEWAQAKIFELAKAFLPVKSHEQLQTDINLLLKTVLEWTLVPGQIATLVQYLPSGIRAAQSLLPPVLAKMWENAKHHCQVHPALISSRLDEISALTKRPTFEEAIGSDEAETIVKRTEIIDRKVDQAIQILRVWVNVLITADGKTLNLPLPEELGKWASLFIEGLFTTPKIEEEESLIIDPNSPPSLPPVAPIKKLLLTYLPLYLPVDYAPQEDEVTDTVKGAFSDLSTLALAGLNQFIEETVEDPEQYARRCNGLLNAITKLANPYLPEEI